MIHIERKLTIEAKPEEAWAVLGNFMHIDEFAPEIKSVEALTDGKIKMGSKRRNHFKNDTSLVEEIIELDQDSWYHKVSLSDMGSMPLHEAESEMYVVDAGNGSSKVIWTMDFRAKFGPLGWLMGQTMMKMMMSKIIDGNLKGLAAKVKSK